jgi:tetratricopeptide (TPR) repeat protein
MSEYPPRSVSFIGLGFFFAIAVGPGCKPAGELPRQVRGSRVEFPEVASSTPAWDGLSSVWTVAEPDPGPGSEPRPKAGAATLAATAGKAPGDPEADELPPADVEMDAPDPLMDGLALARTHQEAGQHQEALAAADQALALRPDWPEARFMRARALAALGRQADALAALEGLANRPGGDANRWLKVARADPELGKLKAIPRFRELSSYVEVEVHWTPRVEGGAAAVAPVVEALGKASIPARPGKEWRAQMPGATLYFSLGDFRSRTGADEVAEALWLPPRRVQSENLGPEDPLVLVVDPAFLAEAQGGGVRAYFDVPLRAIQGKTHHSLTLKATGFFSWEQRLQGGARILQTGRYYLANEGLHLDYQQTAEEPGLDPARPKVTIEQGRRSSHQLRLGAEGLGVGDLVFRPSSGDKPAAPL